METGNNRTGLTESFHLTTSNVTCVTSLDATASLIFRPMSLLVPENSCAPWPKNTGE